MGGICCSSNCCPKKTFIPLPHKTRVHPSGSTFQNPESLVSSASITREYSSDSSLSNTGMSRRNPLDLIEGYQNEPLVSLWEALRPFHEKIPGLPNHIKEAKSKCYYSAKSKLTLDESAAIYIYTMKCGNGCLYDHLQTAWESHSRSELKPWLGFLKLLKSAYDKLPDAKGEMWKGKSFDPKLKEELSSNSSSLYTAMGLFSPSKSSVEQTLHDRRVKQKILIGFKSIGGKLLGEYAAANWNGFFVWPGMKLAVSGMEKTSESSSVTLHMKGLTPTHEPIRKSLILEKHFLCFNERLDYSIAIPFSMICQNKVPVLIVNKVTE